MHLYPKQALLSKTGCVCKTQSPPPPQRNQIQKKLLKPKCHKQGHKVIDIGDIRKGVNSGICKPNVK